MRRLAAQHFLPGNIHGEHRGGRVGDGQAGALVGDPVAIRHPHTRYGAVPGEDDVTAEVDLRQIGQLAIFGDQGANVGQLELPGDVGDPAQAEALLGQQIDARRP